jgi:hypothetical protein
MVAGAGRAGMPPGGGGGGGGGGGAGMLCVDESKQRLRVKDILRKRPKCNDSE